jgi:hypothetical protein
MRVVAYWWLVVRSAWSQLERNDLILSLAAGAIAAAAAALTPLPAWSTVPAFFGGLLAILTVATPARIHDEQQTCIRSMIASIAPRLSVSVDDPKWRTDSKGVYVQLRVKNEGKEAITGCYGKLLEVRRMTAAATAGWIPPTFEPYFVWAEHQAGTNELQATIPPDSDLFLSIATTDSERNDMLFWFAFKQPQAFPLYIVNDLKIEVGALVGMPIRRWYRITGKNAFEMTFEDIGESDEPPPP